MLSFKICDFVSQCRYIENIQLSLVLQISFLVVVKSSFGLILL